MVQALNERALLARFGGGFYRLALASAPSPASAARLSFRLRRFTVLGRSLAGGLGCLLGRCLGDCVGLLLPAPPSAASAACLLLRLFLLGRVSVRALTL